MASAMPCIATCGHQFNVFLYFTPVHRPLILRAVFNASTGVLFRINSNVRFICGYFYFNKRRISNEGLVCSP